MRARQASRYRSGAASAQNHEVLLTIEEGSAAVRRSRSAFRRLDGLLDRGLKIRPMILPDRFIDQDTPERMYEIAGLDAKAIVAAGLSALAATETPPRSGGKWTAHASTSSA